MYLPYLKLIYQCAQCKIVPIILKHRRAQEFFTECAELFYSKGYLTYYNSVRFR